MSEEKKINIKKELLSYLIIFIGSFLLFTFITKFIFKPVNVDGESMHPTLVDHDRGFSNILAKDWEISRLDIVVVEGKGNLDELWVKRVIGLPHDTIYAKDDVLYVNGIKVDEDFLDEEYVDEIREKFGMFTEDFDEVTLGEDEYFLMGDNRRYSMDSRMVGSFHKDEIVSKGIFIYYPFNHIGFYD